MKRSVKIRQQLQERVKKNENGCLIWQGPTYNGRYGRVWYKGQDSLVHRVAYEIAYGKIPEGMYVCHHCDVPLCIEPTHLFLGTAQDNMSDKVAKGRHQSPKGSDHGMAILTDDQVLEILKDQRPQTKIAEEYGIERTTVSHIKTGKRWSHLTGVTYQPQPEKKSLEIGDVVSIWYDRRSQQAIADDFGISRTLVSHIKRGSRHSSITSKLPKI